MIALAGTVPADRPAMRRDCEEILRALKSGPLSVNDIRLECNLSWKEWKIRKAHLLANGLIRPSNVPAKYWRMYEVVR